MVKSTKGLILIQTVFDDEEKRQVHSATEAVAKAIDQRIV